MINLMSEFNVVQYGLYQRYEQIQAKREKLKEFSKIFESNS
jgi:hypothetical protein